MDERKEREAIVYKWHCMGGRMNAHPTRSLDIQ